MLVVKGGRSAESRIPRSEIPADALCLQHPKVCPECLRESRYCRSIWKDGVRKLCANRQCNLALYLADVDRRASEADRKAAGVRPVMRLKSRVKWLWSEKPAAMA